MYELALELGLTKAHSKDLKIFEEFSTSVSPFLVLSAAWFFYIIICTHGAIDYPFSNIVLAGLKASIQDSGEEINRGNDVQTYHHRLNFHLTKQQESVRCSGGLNKNCPQDRASFSANGNVSMLIVMI